MNNKELKKLIAAYGDVCTEMIDTAAYRNTLDTVANRKSIFYAEHAANVYMTRDEILIPDWCIESALAGLIEHWYINTKEPDLYCLTDKGVKLAISFVAHWDIELDDYVVNINHLDVIQQLCDELKISNPFTT